MIEIILFLILLSISVLLIKRRFEHRPDWTKKTQTPAQPAAPSRISTIWAAMKKDLLSTAVVAVILLGIVYGVFSYWQDNLASPDKAFTFGSQQEFQQYWQVISGNCQVTNGYLSGECEIVLKNSENLDWWKIKVVPPDFNDPGGPAEIKEVSITVKEFTFKHYIGASAYGWEGTKNLLFYQGKVYYYSKQDSKNYLISGGNMEKQRESDLPLPFTVTKSKSGFPAGNFQLFVGEKRIANAYYPSGVGYLEGGPIRIQISKGTKIKQVEIY